MGSEVQEGIGVKARWEVGLRTSGRYVNENVSTTNDLLVWLDVCHYYSILYSQGISGLFGQPDSHTMVVILMLGLICDHSEMIQNLKCRSIFFLKRSSFNEHQDNQPPSSTSTLVLAWI